MDCPDCGHRNNPTVAFCAECGTRLFQLEEDRSLSGRLTKARREGVGRDEHGDREYASLGARLGAAIVDNLLINGACGIWYWRLLETSPENVTPPPTPFLVAAIVWVFYEPFMTAGWGGTIGKLLVRIKVGDNWYDRPGVGRAYGRFLLKTLINAIPLGIIVSALVAAHDPERRMLHDRLSGTWVRPAHMVD